MKLIDLTHPMRADMHGEGMQPHMNLRLVPTRGYAADGMLTITVEMGTHMGTHIDGPAHVIEDGASLGDLPLETFYGTGVVLAIPKGMNETIAISDLESAQPGIVPGDIVLISTGWWRRMGTIEYRRDHPYVTPEAAEWLVNRKIKMVGVDLLSPDLPWSLKTDNFHFTTLRLFLEADIPVILNLASLHEIEGRRVDVLALPIIFEGVDSGPARVVAMVDNTAAK
jgi:arylformamidase